ncbi:hypothetical protein [Nonlabens sp.]|uniref:hypothetical protein n=1 Tax=Nonlabens sp. TaxID=1888209 RepID=UPI003F698E5D
MEEELALKLKIYSHACLLFKKLKTKLLKNKILKIKLGLFLVSLTHINQLKHFIMRKLVFAALAGVFMLSSGFTTSSLKIEDENYDEDLSCECACYFIAFIGGELIEFEFFARSAQSCTSQTQGMGSFDTEDCQNTSGMLNAPNAETFQEAQNGGGC